MTTDGITSCFTSDDELRRLRAEVELLRVRAAEHGRENELLRAQRAQLLEQQAQHARTIDQLQQQLQSLLRRVYGRSAEKLDPKQMRLFETLLDHLAPKTFVPPEPPPSAAPGSESPAARPSRNGHGRRRLPCDLPRQKVLHDLPQEQKPCPCCGQPRHVIGQEVSEQLDYVPAKLSVIEHVRLTYACRHCEQQAAESGSQIETASKPLSPIEKGLAAPGLLSYVIVSKYGDHLPLYRLEHILQRHGVEIARSTMCDWMAQCAALLRPLHDLMIREVRASKVIHTDDTPVDVLDRDRTQTRTGRFWVYLGDRDHPFTVFTYTPSRSRDGPMEFLRDWGRDRRVYLQADAFGGYDGIYAGQAGGAVTEVACWAHARRKFYEARNSDAAVSTQALAYIRLLYDVEDEANRQFQNSARKSRGADASCALEPSPCAPQPCEQNLSGAPQPSLPLDDAALQPSPDDAALQPSPDDAALQPSPDDAALQPSPDDAALQPSPDDAGPQPALAAIRHALRRERAVPRLQQFHAWLQSQQAQRGGPVLPKSPLGEAITYAFNQWEALTVYTTDGDLAIDNNASENALRRVALGRKNWLFCGSDNGGHTAAVLFSLIATCQRHKVEPFAYLRNLLTRIAAHPVSRLAELLPTTNPPA